MMMLIKVSDDDHDGDNDFFAAATGNLPVPPINQCNSTQLSGEHVASLYPPTPHHHLHHFEKKCIIGFFFSKTILSLTENPFSKYRWFFL